MSFVNVFCECIFLVPSRYEENRQLLHVFLAGILTAIMGTKFQSSEQTVLSPPEQYRNSLTP